MNATAHARHSSPDVRSLQAAGLREDFVHAPGLRDSFATRSSLLVADTLQIFADDDALDSPPLAGHIRHDTAPAFAKLSQALPDDRASPARFAAWLLALLYHDLFVKCLLNAERYDEGLIGTGDLSCPNAVFFLAFLDIMKESLKTILDSSDIEHPQLLYEALARDHEQLANIARSLSRIHSDSQ